MTFYYQTEGWIATAQQNRKIINCVQRIDHVRILNYMEVVDSYYDDEFITHFRMSRDVVDDLIQRYNRSPVYEMIIGNIIHTLCTIAHA